MKEYSCGCQYDKVLVRACGKLQQQIDCWKDVPFTSKEQREDLIKKSINSHLGYSDWVSDLIAERA